MAIFKGKKSASVSGTSANDTITSGGGYSTISGGGGNDTYNFEVAGDNSVVTGGAGSDAFVVKVSTLGDNFFIDGGTSAVAAASSNTTAGSSTTTPTTNYSGSLGTGNTDATLVIQGRPGASTSINTATTVLGTPNAVDSVTFTKSGDFTNIKGFAHIEQLRLADGVSIKLTMEQFLANLQSLDNGVTNPGCHVYGVAGGKTETLQVVADYADSAFIPASTVPAGMQRYSIANFQLDDSGTAQILHDVNFIFDLKTESDDDSYGRADGTNNDDIVYGSNGVDNLTLRLGNDTAYGGTGNDVIFGHGGADLLFGGAGNDLFGIGGFGTGNPGTTSKADDGRAEWIISTADGSRTGITNGVTDTTYGNKVDLIDGGSGIDTLRVTTGIGATSKAKGTVVLSDANFKNMEVVQVGGLLSRANSEDTNTQIINSHYYLDAAGRVSDTATTVAKGNLAGSSLDNVVIDASGVTKNGLTFEGNGNKQTFIGTSQSDRFVGNGGADTLTGGLGNDTFVFGKVLSYAVVGTATDAQGYGLKDSAITSDDADVITDFTSGKDKIELHVDQFDKLGAYYQDDDGIYTINPATVATSANFVSGAGAVPASATHYLIYNTTTGVLSYDADGNGSGAALTIATLVGSPTLVFSDFVIR